MIELEINNKVYRDFKSFNIRRDIESLFGQYTIDITRGIVNTMPVALFQPIRILAFGEAIITGRIENIRTGANPNTNTIQIQGRDITADLVDSTIGSLTKFSNNVSLSYIIQTYLNYLGMTSTKIINEVGTLTPFRPDEIVQFRPSDTCFSVMDRYAKKRQVLLTTDGKGNIVITRPNDDDSIFDVETDATGNFSIRQILDQPKDSFFCVFSKNGTSNVKNAEVNIDMTERFYQYTARSQQNPVSKTNRTKTDAAKLITTLYTTFDTQVPVSRKKDIFFDSVTRPEDVKNRLEWQKKYNIANSFQYTANIPGISASNKRSALKPNTVCQVYDELNGIDDVLLIGSVEYTLDVTGGLATFITIKHPDAYETFDTKKPKKKRKKKGRRKKVRVTDASFFNDVLKEIENLD